MQVSANRIRKPKQQSFSFIEPIKKDFGGSLLRGKRKSKRPLSFKKPMHFVLKSTKARGPLSFVNHLRKVESAITEASQKSQVKIYGKAVNYNHIHLVVHLPDEDHYKTWIRVLPAQIAEAVGARESLFDLRPHSTIVEWGRQFEAVKEYLTLNQMEIFGMRPAKSKLLPRKTNCI
jgi:hypothetical protein